MSSFNKVVLLGNLTRDPELRNLPSGNSVAEFGIAVNRKYTTSDGVEKEESTFVDVEVFGKQAEIIAKYVKKGRQLLVEGRLKYDSWEKDGVKRSKLSVVLESFSFVNDGNGANAESENQKTKNRESTNSSGQVARAGKAKQPF